MFFIFVCRVFTCRPRTGLLTDKYQVLEFFKIMKKCFFARLIIKCLLELFLGTFQIVFDTVVITYKMCTMCRDKMYRDSNKYIDRLINCKFFLSHCLISFCVWILYPGWNRNLCFFYQLIVFKMMPTEAKTFKHTVKCKLNDADKFTQV